jgi:NAD(P)-dependent dehydrogenase (short-subunit alcohol dehydrogenase family)
MSRLQGHVAVVTGAGSGIGRATAAALAGEGARVVLVGRRREALEQTAAELPQDATWVYPADVTDREQVAALFDDVADTWGPVDFLVNNAGINTPRRNIADISVDDWERVLAVNLTGVFLCTRAALARMRGRGGRVVNIGSVAGLRASAGGGIGYCASKHGVAGLTHALNLEENANGIHATAIHPGEVDTPILDNRPAPPTKAHRARILRAEDVAAAVLFVLTRPQGVHIPELVIKPIEQRLD